MSNALAIGAVTGSLSSLLQNVNQGTGLSGVSITTQPPDRARNGKTGNQINLFLYQVLPNAAWRNMDIPQRVRSGETAMPPLALNLYYMLTAFGDSDDDLFGHLLLGHAMRILYDHALLGPPEIQAALSSVSGGLDSELQNQIERVRITLQPLSVEEIFRLWSGFQTQYRVSVSYEVAVVLIDSTIPTKTPLPVLTRGKDDRGVMSQPDLFPPLPTLDSVTPPNQQASARVGDILTLKGFHLDVTNPRVRFTHTRFGPLPKDVSPEAGATADTIQVKVPDTPDVHAGFYTLAVIFNRSSDGAEGRTNELPFSLAPQIEPPISVMRDAVSRNVEITFNCKPTLQPMQRVSLLIGAQEVPLKPGSSPLTFDAGDIQHGDYFIRLRVDGVDSLLVDRTVTPPRFDPSQKVTVPS
jgi:hypothetical protein